MNIYRVLRLFTLALFIIIASSNPLWARTVTLPLTIDYQLLRSLVVKTAFTDPGPSAILVDEHNECWEIKISEPLFAEENGLLRFQTKVYVYAGVFAFNKCILPVEWEGYLVLYQVPEIGDQWILSFDTADSALYNEDFEPATIAGIIWNIVKTTVIEYLSSITINLAPPVSELKLFIEPLFPEEHKARAHRLINSMRPGKAKTQADSVRVDVVADVEDIYEKDKDREVEKLSKTELNRLVATWETWDAYLVHIITSLTQEPLSDEDRQVLLDVLLETRYRFISELDDDTLKKDFVREQFVAAWKKLSPLFRNHLGDDPSQDLLGYLAFFTASDALSALDKIGLSLGIEISRNGLVRLARMIVEKEEEILSYTVRVNKELRDILGFGPPLVDSETSFFGEEIEIDTETSFLNIMIPRVWATNVNPKQKNQKLREIMKWVLKDRSNINPYIGRIKSLISEVIKENLDKSALSSIHHDTYRRLVLSTAWQESCLRQFKIRKKKITYIRSYNRTSVGLMQINERIWRGLYDRNQLRWNIRYNCMAGGEILELYFRKYALSRLKKHSHRKPTDDTALSGLVYAMYNGGPGQFKKYLSRLERGKYYLSDRLFAEKLAWVSRNEWDKIKICLVGK